MAASAALPLTVPQENVPVEQQGIPSTMPAAVAGMFTSTQSSTLTSDEAAPPNNETSSHNSDGYEITTITDQTTLCAKTIDSFENWAAIVERHAPIF
jgi:hypothetical protein